MQVPRVSSQVMPVPQSLSTLQVGAETQVPDHSSQYWPQPQSASARHCGLLVPVGTQVPRVSHSKPEVQSALLLQKPDSAQVPPVQ
jgi:hypothetical protein